MREKAIEGQEREWHEGWIGGVHDENRINGFFGEYRWLSNYHECPVMFKGLIFKSSEAAYQAAKSLNPTDWLRFSNMEPGESKKEGRKLKLREDWDEVKDEIMRNILFDKFLRNKDLREKLIATDKKQLEETNWWGDTYWGVCDGKGENKLGKTLMEIRGLMKIVESTGH